MNWEDQGYLLNKKKFRENANIISVFTKKYGKMTGIVYGGNSRKIRNYLQICNKIFLTHNSSRSNKIGYLKTEIIQAISPKYFDDKKRSSSLLSISELLNTLLPESQSYSSVYNSLNEFIEDIDNENWLISYIFWEINLIRELGFGFDFSKTKVDKEIISTTIDGLTYNIPKFIINNQFPEKYSLQTIYKSLNFTRSLMLNKFYLPNNLFFPRSRLILENYFI